MEAVRVFLKTQGKIFESLALEKNSGVRFVTKRNFGKEKTYTEIQCKIEEISSPRMGQRIYYISPVVDLKLPEDVKFFPELELVECFDGSKNIVTVVTDRKAARLAPRWRGHRRLEGKKDGPIIGTGTYGFRTVKGELVIVEVGVYSGMGSVVAYRFCEERDKMFLVEERLANFTVKGTTIHGQSEKEQPVVAWANDVFGYIESAEEKGRIMTAFTEVVGAAVEKSDHNCYRECCEPHWALSFNEARELQKKINEEKRNVKVAVEEKTTIKEVVEVGNVGNGNVGDGEKKRKRVLKKKTKLESKEKDVLSPTAV
ncbi:MAG: hypothetical protein QMD50_02465 [Patescibacteria group bacterium]|nr:hypothetical protein [Patescibacteria group bacterium]